MADPECGDGELVGDPGVKVVPVVSAESGVERPQPEDLHEAGTDQDGEELVVHNVLPLGVHDALGLLNKKSNKKAQLNVGKYNVTSIAYLKKYTKKDCFHFDDILVEKNGNVHI